MDKWYTYMNNVSVTCFERDLNVKNRCISVISKCLLEQTKGGGGREQTNNVSSANFVEKKRKIKVYFAYKNYRAKSFFNVHSVNIVSSRVRFV